MIVAFCKKTSQVIELQNVIILILIYKEKFVAEEHYNLSSYNSQLFKIDKLFFKISTVVQLCINLINN